jgi:hypothetical protein
MIFETLATFRTQRTLHDLFRTGSLMRTWASAYPQLFDERDVRNAEGQCHLGYHFHEWLAAILVLHTRGELSLLKKYAFTSHTDKRATLEKLVPPDSRRLFTSGPRARIRHWPDLLVYSADHTDWFFCEVKGPSDTLRPEQANDFESLARETGKPVRLVKLVEDQR